MCGVKGIQNENKIMNKLKKYFAGINMMALSSMLRYWIAVVYVRTNE